MARTWTAFGVMAAAGLMAVRVSADMLDPPREATAPVRAYQLVACYPHDPEAFTQGLLIRNGQLFESTGLNGRSSLRRVDLDTGRVLQRHDVPRRYFAEGLTEHGGELFQLTWETGVAFVYDLRTFAPRRTLRYRGEGWGLTTDGTRLIMSDGSDTLRFLDPGTFAETGRLQVRDGTAGVERLNELEFVDGSIYANVWLTDRIAVIDPRTGAVTAWLDLAALNATAGQATNAVLNGIAYDRDGDRLFVTGKLWPTLFEIRVLWEDTRMPRPPDVPPDGPKRGCS